MNIAGVYFAITVFVDKDLKSPAKGSAYKSANDNRGNCEMHFDEDSISENETREMGLATRCGIIFDTVLGPAAILLCGNALFLDILWETKKMLQGDCITFGNQTASLECRSAALKLASQFRITEVQFEVLF